MCYIFYVKVRLLGGWGFNNTVNDTIFKNLFSNCSLQVYTTDFVCLFVYSVILLNLFNCNGLFLHYATVLDPPKKIISNIYIKNTCVSRRLVSFLYRSWYQKSGCTHWYQTESCRQSLGKVEKNSYIALPGNGGHSGLMPSRRCPNLMSGEPWGVL